jgi:16S rRNA (cytidine1402-2'-O)-methyltransferase
MTGLFVVPTPVGNLADITLRALEILKTVKIVYAEDTRTTGNLFRHYGISTPLRAFHLHNEHKVVDGIVRQMKDFGAVALVSDAGTPGISDPGYLLVRACIREGIKVQCLPGATALIPALVMSGFPTDRFCFDGFLPLKKGRQTRIKAWLEEERTVVFYESPHRILKTLLLMKEILGEERHVAVVREISKMFEEIVIGTLLEAYRHFEQFNPKGEFVMVLSGVGYKPDNE